MKEYKYKINGNDYKVAVGDIEGNVDFKFIFFHNSII